MKLLLKILYVFFSVIFLSYLALPNPEFPSPPPDALQSDEPADTETPLRRAYFTNLTREEVMNHYKNQLIKSSFVGIPLPTYRLNYPPEEAQTIIRDQTRSTFLEEIVHPFRESVFVNGFEPKTAKDAIFIGGRDWRQKIIIRFVPSVTYIRLIIGVLTLSLIPVLYSEIRKVLNKNA
jgi:hypothetical protein